MNVTSSLATVSMDTRAGYGLEMSILLLIRPFYGCLCTFFGSVEFELLTSWTLTIPIKISYLQLNIINMLVRCCFKTWMVEKIFIKWVCLCTFFASCVATIQSLNQVLARL